MKGEYRLQADMSRLKSDKHIGRELDPDSIVPHAIITENFIA